LSTGLLAILALRSSHDRVNSQKLQLGAKHKRDFSLRRSTASQERSGKRKRRPAPFGMTVTAEVVTDTTRVRRLCGRIFLGVRGLGFGRVWIVWRPCGGADGEVLGRCGWR
jgi:hypothetical protein